jgi:cytochrome c-type biogenesis protein CcmH
LDDDARDALEKQLKCQCGCILDVYTCRTTDFTCSVSPAMHRDVMRLIAGGYNEEEILAAFVETYGEVALTAPVKEGFNWLGYLAPGIVLATGALLLTLMLRRWSVAAAAARAASAAAPSSRAASTGASVDEMERLARALREDS